MEKLDLENTLFLDLKNGRVVIKLEPDYAPMHVKRIKELVRSGFYDGIVFHRVIAGFMAQTGDPTGTGMGGSGKNIKSEFNVLPHTRGAVSMARAQDPNSADSQFFIVFDDATFLDRQYTVWGYVVEGMEFIDKIKKGSESENGMGIKNPDKIIKMSVAADVKGASSKKKTKKSKAKKAVAKKTTTKKVAKKSTAKKVAKKPTAKKTAPKKAVKKSAPKKTTAKKATAKKVVAKKPVAKKTVKKAPAKKVAAKKVVKKAVAKKVAKKTTAKKAVAKKPTVKKVAKKTAPKKATKKVAKKTAVKKPVKKAPAKKVAKKAVKKKSKKS